MSGWMNKNKTAFELPKTAEKNCSSTMQWMRLKAQSFPCRLLLWHDLWLWLVLVFPLSAYAHSSSCFAFFLTRLCLQTQKMSGIENQQDVNIYLERQHAFVMESCTDTTKAQRTRLEWALLCQPFSFETAEQDWSIQCFWFRMGEWELLKSMPETSAIWNHRKMIL